MLSRWDQLANDSRRPLRWPSLPSYPGASRWLTPKAAVKRKIYVETVRDEGYGNPRNRIWESQFTRSRIWFTLDMAESFVVRDFVQSYFFEFESVSVVISDRTNWCELASHIRHLATSNLGVNVWLAVEPYSRLDSPDFPAFREMLRQFIGEGKLTMVVLESDLTLPEGEQISVRVEQSQTPF